MFTVDRLEAGYWLDTEIKREGERLILASKNGVNNEWVRLSVRTNNNEIDWTCLDPVFVGESQYLTQRDIDVVKRWLKDRLSDGG